MRWFSQKKQEPSKPVYCEDCRWAKISAGIALCARPGPFENSISREYPGRLCIDERGRIYYGCGPRGDFFEPKEVTHDQSEG